MVFCYQPKMTSSLTWLVPILLTPLTSICTSGSLNPPSTLLPPDLLLFACSESFPSTYLHALKEFLANHLWSTNIYIFLRELTFHIVFLFCVCFVFTQFWHKGVSVRSSLFHRYPGALEPWGCFSLSSHPLSDGPGEGGGWRGAGERRCRLSRLSSSFLLCPVVWQRSTQALAQNRQIVVVISIIIIIIEQKKFYMWF